jgi:hypothetical protein
MLAASRRFDDRLRATILYYANLEGSASSELFAPIHSFFAIGAEDRVFSRTIYLGPTPRGNDYLVHSIILGKADLAALDYQPFRLEDAGAFTLEKPAQGTVLIPVEIESLRSVAPHTIALDSPTIASCLRALARRPLRLRVDDPATAGAICRAIHESLPPTDRVQTTFCTRFSRKLDFQLAAYVADDEGRVRQQSAGAELIQFPPPPNSGTKDFYDRWAAEARGEPDFDLVTLSILREPEETFALIEGVRKLRLWTTGPAVDVPHDLASLKKPAALVLLDANRNRAAIQSVLPGALAVDLSSRIETTLRTGGSFEPSAQNCSDMPPAVRRNAARWIRSVSTTATQAWIAEALLLLPDANLGAVLDVLQRDDRGRLMLIQLQKENATAYRTLAGTVLARMRDRFGIEGGRASASVARRLADESDALLSFVRVMEETAARDTDRARQTAWLLAIVRDVAHQTALPPQVPARIILANNLLGLIEDEIAPDEIETLASALIRMEEKLAPALDAIEPATAPRLYRALASALHDRIQVPWTPQTLPAIDVVKRLLLGAAIGIQLDGDAVTSHRLTVLAFLAASIFSDDARAVLADAIGEVVDTLVQLGVDETEAVLLIKTIQKLSRIGKGTRVRRRTILTLRESVRGRKPAESVLMNLRWHLRMCTLLEVGG